MSMTVADLLEVIEFGERDIFIKPTGRRTYFDGTVATVPECLKQCTIRSLAPQIYPNYTSTPAFGFIPDSNRLFRSGFGVWIDHIPELDELVDLVPGYWEDFSGKEYDKLYQDFLLVREKEKVFNVRDKEEAIEKIRQASTDRRIKEICESEHDDEDK